MRIGIPKEGRTKGQSPRAPVPDPGAPRPDPEPIPTIGRPVRPRWGAGTTPDFVEASRGGVKGAVRIPTLPPDPSFRHRAAGRRRKIVPAFGAVAGSA